MRFTGTFIGAKLDLSKFQQQLEDTLVKLLHEGSKAWLQVVAGSGGRVPLWSGMARASLLELSELVGGRVVLSPKKAESRVPQGRQLGTAVQEISKSKVKITITTRVPHYSTQEYQNVGVSPSAPWLSRQAGRAAFQSIDAKLPRPKFKPVKIKAI